VPVAGAVPIVTADADATVLEFLAKMDDDMPEAVSVPLPTVVGAHWKSAEQVLNSLGANVKFKPGPVNPSNISKVYEQEPAAGSKFNLGDTVILTIFVGPG
jgi:beta-lactam-binding protein with PASTA domain